MFEVCWLEVGCEHGVECSDVFGFILYLVCVVINPDSYLMGIVFASTLAAINS